MDQVFQLLVKIILELQNHRGKLHLAHPMLSLH